MIGVLLFLNSRGDIILSRAFRDHFNIRVLADTFRDEIISTKKAEKSPVVILDKVCYCHLRYEAVFVVLCGNTNLNCMLCFQYIIRLLQLLKSYFGSIEEYKLKEGFVTVQELVDETMDYGYPQLTEIDVLKSFINTSGSRSEVLKRKIESEQVTIKATGKNPWRKDGVTYMKNEVFLDVVEDVNILLSQSGDVLQREVNGRVVVKGFLSGMPQCKLCLNDKLLVDKIKDEAAPHQIELDDVTFHACVQLGKFDSDRSICFIPPDGEFVLMRYRSTATVRPPIRVISSRVKEVAKTRIEVDFRVKAEFPMQHQAVDILVRIPCPPNTANVNVRVSAGKAKYEANSQAIIWKIKKLQGGVELGFSTEIQLIASTLQTNEKQWSRQPLTIDFQIPMYAASGLKVVYLHVTEPKLQYDAIKWVRYMTTGGQYQCRI